MRLAHFSRLRDMFSILFRVLTIAGTFTIAALLTRRYMQRRALREDHESSGSGASSGAEKSAVAGGREGSALQGETHRSPEPSQRKKKRVERKAGRHLKLQHDGDADDADAADDTTGEFEEEQDAGLETELAQKPEAVQKQGAAQKQEQDPAAREAVSVLSGAAAERARIVIQSSRQILDNYKHPEGLNVDLSLAHFSLDTAERLMAQSRFEDAWEKAGAVGMIVGMAEMRAAVERQLKDLGSEPSGAERAKEIRKILAEADRCLAEASKSFVQDSGAGASSYISHLQAAFQKNTEAQAELVKAIARRS
jgi:hypothetical protein